MTLEMALVLLTVLPIVTSLLTEFVKWVLDLIGAKYASNAIVLCVAAVVGGGVTMLYYLSAGVPWTALNIVMIFVMILANAVGATIDYDKGKQLVTQIMTVIKK